MFLAEGICMLDKILSESSRRELSTTVAYRHNPLYTRSSWSDRSMWSGYRMRCRSIMCGIDSLSGSRALRNMFFASRAWHYDKVQQRVPQILCYSGFGGWWRFLMFFTQSRCLGMIWRHRSGGMLLTLNEHFVQLPLMHETLKKQTQNNHQATATHIISSLSFERTFSTKISIEID